MKKYPTKIEILRELSYSPTTGVFIRIKPDGRSRNKSSAGYTSQNGYVKISILNYQWFAHRLAWIVYYGKEAELPIDHIDKNKSNNAIDNLRLATKSQNARNVGVRKDNKIGITGLHWHKRANKWMVSIAINGVNKYLGLYDSLLEAACIRKSAEIYLEHKY